MNIGNTIYSNWVIDFRKLLIYFGVIALSIIPSLNDSIALSIAIIIQGVGNIDNYWDMLSQKGVHKPLRTFTIIIILLSFTAVIVSLMNVFYGQIIFKNGTFGIFVKWLLLLMICSPIPLIGYDMELNINNEQGGKQADEYF